jgi:hypothetical protein
MRLSHLLASDLTAEIFTQPRTIMKNFAAILMISAVTLGVAGCQTPNDVSDSYKFQLEGKPVFADDGATISVRLVRADGSPVSDAEVYATRWVDTGLKSVPRRLQRMPMHADGKGLFTYSSDKVHEGDTLQVEANLPPSGSTVQGRIYVP